VHPIERLRYVARAEGADPALVAVEAASALAAVAAEDPAGLVPACRRLIDFHPTYGPVWWLAAQVLADADPGRAARRAGRLLSDDSLPASLGRALPDDATVAIVGWPDATVDALRRRGDLEVLAVDGGGEGASLARRLAGMGSAVAEVSDAGAAAAAVVADLAVVEGLAAGPTGVLARIGSHNVAVAAASAGVPVWLAAGTGRLLPGPLWDALLARLDAGGTEPWEREVEVVPSTLVSHIVDPDGEVGDVPAWWVSPDIPVAVELLRVVD
jgi:hypothetical protein